LSQGCELQHILTGKPNWNSPGQAEWLIHPDCGGPFIIHTNTEEYWTIGRIILGTNLVW
jgi:hypothetical protein